jgi:hypothetical protein
MMRKQLFNAMVSQYSSALILLGVVNVDETVISKDLQKKIHKIDLMPLFCPTIRPIDLLQCCAYYVPFCGIFVPRLCSLF